MHVGDPAALKTSWSDKPGKNDYRKHKIPDKNLNCWKQLRASVPLWADKTPVRIARITAVFFFFFQRNLTVPEILWNIFEALTLVTGNMDRYLRRITSPKEIDLHNKILFTSSRGKLSHNSRLYKIHDTYRLYTYRFRQLRIINIVNVIKFQAIHDK